MLLGSLFPHSHREVYRPTGPISRPVSAGALLTCRELCFPTPLYVYTSGSLVHQHKRKRSRTPERTVGRARCGKPGSRFQRVSRSLYYIVAESARNVRTAVITPTPTEAVENRDTVYHCWLTGSSVQSVRVCVLYHTTTPSRARFGIMSHS